MARRTVKVTIPDTRDPLVTLIETALLRNDGVLPSVPASTLPQQIAALVGLTISVAPSTTTSTTTTTTPTTSTTTGTRKLPEDLAVKLRALYPALKREVLDLKALETLAPGLGDSIASRLGLADGQTVQTEGTARNLVHLAVKSLLVTFAGRESELEGYGVGVVIGTAAAPKKKTKPPTA